MYGEWPYKYWRWGKEGCPFHHSHSYRTQAILSLRYLSKSLGNFSWNAHTQKKTITITFRVLCSRYAQSSTFRVVFREVLSIYLWENWNCSTEFVLQILKHWKSFYGNCSTNLITNGNWSTFLRAHRKSFYWHFWNRKSYFFPYFNLKYFILIELNS